MARALECPACGARHRLDAVPNGSTFRCEQCGQMLKAPAAVSSQPGAPPPPARTGAAPMVSSSSPPRREAAPTGYVPTAAAGGAAAGAASAKSVSATLPANGASAPAPEQAPAKPRSAEPPAPSRAAPAKRSRVAWYWRVVAWIVAVPLGFVVTAWPAYELGFIKKDDLLDIFVGTGIGRYLRLAIVTVVWALVTALLVQLFVEGGRVRANRRRRARAATG
jgi:hypothetical protein